MAPKSAFMTKSPDNSLYSQIENHGHKGISMNFQVNRTEYEPLMFCLQNA